MFGKVYWQSFFLVLLYLNFFRYSTHAHFTIFGRQTGNSTAVKQNENETYENETNENEAYKNESIENKSYTNELKTYDEELNQSEINDIPIVRNETGRSLSCIPMLKTFEVELERTLEPGEAVALTGDHVRLGNWQIDKSLSMKARRRNPLKWFVRIPMCSSLRILYRFFIYHMDGEGFKRLRRWEGQQHARVIESYEFVRRQGSKKFGYALPKSLGGGYVQNEKGWLRQEFVMQLKFVWPQHIRFTSFEHFIRNPRYKLKLKENLYPRQSRIEVTHFQHKKSQLRPHLTSAADGEFYKPGSVVVFHISCWENQAYLLELTIYTMEMQYLGTVLMSSAKILNASEGILEMPILDLRQNKRIGWLTLPYLIIRSMPEALHFNLRASFHHYWPMNWPTLDIGQRGLGKTFHYNSAASIENTLESFQKALELQADMVEMDVQLTKDYVPIAWHDYGFYTPAKTTLTEANQHLEYVFIKDLTYRELRLSRVFANKQGVIVEMAERQQLFPKLKDILRNLPQTLGLLLEIKWPQLKASGSFEAYQSLDKNEFVNALLKLTISQGCGRPIIFSSLDADICSMLRYKQAIYPVIFQTIGEYSPWEQYADMRTQTYENALNFVQSADILGTAVYAREFIDSPNAEDAILRSFELQQALFLWGDDLQNSIIQKYFQSLEVAGLIYDNLDLVMRQRGKRLHKWTHKKIRKKSVILFEAELLQLIFQRQCIIAGNMSIDEGVPLRPTLLWPRLRSMDEL